MTSHHDESPPFQALTEEQSLNKSKKIDEVIVEIVNSQHQSDSSSPSTYENTCSSSEPLTINDQQQMNSEGKDEQMESSFDMPSEQEQRKKIIIEVGRLLAKMGDALLNQRRI